MILKQVCSAKTMRRLFLFAFSLVMFGQISAQGVPAGEYDLFIPVIREKAGSYDSEIQSYRVRLEGHDSHQYLVPQAEHLDWFVGGAHKRKKALLLQSKGQEGLELSGFWIKGEGFLRIDFTGTAEADSLYSGTGTIALGSDPELKQFPMVYKVEWALCPVNVKATPQISTWVDYEGEPPRVAHVQVGSHQDVERDLKTRPPINALSIKAISYEAPDVRREKVERLSKAKRKYVEDLLAEMTWEEIREVPGIILLVDHLAGLDESQQRNVAKAYVRDGTADYLDSFSYEKIKELPAPLLLIHCYPRLDKRAKGNLKKASMRFELLLDEAEKSSDTSQAALENAMIKVLSRMSKNEQEHYFRQSKKLRSFVKSSQSAELKTLLPDDSK